jgi:hypothetical protein
VGGRTLAVSGGSGSSVFSTAAGSSIHLSEAALSRGRAILAAAATSATAVSSDDVNPVPLSVPMPARVHVSGDVGGRSFSSVAACGVHVEVSGDGRDGGNGLADRFGEEREERVCWANAAVSENVVSQCAAFVRNGQAFDSGVEVTCPARSSGDRLLDHTLGVAICPGDGLSWTCSLSDELSYSLLTQASGLPQFHAGDFPGHLDLIALSCSRSSRLGVLNTVNFLNAVSIVEMCFSRGNACCKCLEEWHGFDKTRNRPAPIDKLIMICFPNEMSCSDRDWVEFQVRWVVWTLASFERTNSRQYLGKLLSCCHLRSSILARYANYLKYTGPTGPVKGRDNTRSRLALKHCLYSGAILAPLVVCIHFSNAQDNCDMQITDGWWWCDVKVDNLINDKLIKTVCIS